MVHESKMNDTAEIVILDNFFDAQMVICMLRGNADSYLELSFLRISLETRLMENDRSESQL